MEGGGYTLDISLDISDLNNGDRECRRVCLCVCVCVYGWVEGWVHLVDLYLYLVNNYNEIE